MSEKTYFKSKEQMIDAIKSADQVYLLTISSDGEPSLMHRFNEEDMGETIAFIVANFLFASDLLVDMDRAMAIASGGSKELLPAETMRAVQVLAAKIKMNISRGAAGGDDDDDE